MNIKHRPLFNTKMIEKHYSEKDGVPVKYVCSSAIGNEAQAMDIFYRETPHPEFGNRYFGLYIHPISTDMMITNADAIEDQDFAMIRDYNADYHYSQHRHDYVAIGNSMVDGGRAYTRSTGTLYHFKLKDGKFSKIS